MNNMEFKKIQLVAILFMVYFTGCGQEPLKLEEKNPEERLVDVKSISSKEYYSGRSWDPTTESYPVYSNTIILTKKPDGNFDVQQIKKNEHSPSAPEVQKNDTIGEPFVSKTKELFLNFKICFTPKYKSKEDMDRGRVVYAPSLGINFCHYKICDVSDSCLREEADSRDLEHHPYICDSRFDNWCSLLETELKNKNFELNPSL